MQSYIRNVKTRIWCTIADEMGVLIEQVTRTLLKTTFKKILRVNVCGWGPNVKEVV